MGSTLDTIKKNLEKKSTLSLTDILSYSQDDYTESSISIIKEILLSRGVTELEIKTLEDNFKSLVGKIEKTNTQKNVPFYKRAFFWILTMESLAIVSYFTKMIGKTVGENLAKSQVVDRKIFFTDSMAQGIRNSIMNDTTISLGKTAKEYYCNCYIETLRAKFPMPTNKIMPDDSIKIIAQNCLERLKESGLK